MRQEEIRMMRQLRETGLSYAKIAKETEHSQTTVMKYCKDIKPDKSLAVRGAGMIQLPSNPLNALANLEDLVKLSTSTGVAVGSSIASLHKGFTDDSLKDTDRMMHVMKGSAFIGNVIFSTYRTLQELTEQTKAQEQKTVSSPSYEELVEKVRRLEADNDVIEKKKMEDS